MIRLLFGLFLGAGLMYFLDPRNGSDRRRMVMDRAGRGDGASFTERADEALQAGRDVYSDAKDRIQTTAGHAMERAKETAGEARSQASEWAGVSRERAQSAAANGNNES